MNDALTFRPTDTNTRNEPSHEQISERAQQLWESYGRPSGRDEEIWLAAENELKAPAPASNNGSMPPSSQTGETLVPGKATLPPSETSPRAPQRATPSRRGGKSAAR